MNGNFSHYGYSQNGSYNNSYNDIFINNELYFRKKNEKAMLKKLSLYAGSAILLTMLLQNCAVMLLVPLGIYDLYFDNQFFQSGFDIILTIIGMLLPFALFGRKMKKISGEAEPVPLGMPKDKKLTFLAVIGGVGACLAANYITSFVIIFMSIFGYELSSPDVAMPGGAFGVFLAFVRISLVAAVVEELSLRGYVMGNLRRYGDRFAIVMSAFVFAFIHGNLIQAPFALAAGIALGYLCVKTNSLWTGVFIHAINNGISVAISYLTDVLPEETITSVYGMIMLVFISVGSFCLYLFVKYTKNRPLRKNFSLLSSRERVCCYLLSPTMIIAMLIMLYITANFIKKV